jgi:serralysin
VALDRDGAGGQGYRLYVAALNRSPDVKGLGYWIATLDNGATLETVAQNFIDSAEFTNIYGTLDNTRFITQLYSNVLHRTPDDEGLAWHLNNLKAGYSRAYELAFFSESAENQGNVATLIANGISYTPYG